ncbi:HAD family hydrolase [Bradyrhizobium sp. USDA 4353]
MNLSDIRAVIFDMDGLLVDSERLARAALIETAGRFGITADLDIFTRMIGLPEDSSLTLLRHRFGVDFAAEDFIQAAATACHAMVECGQLELKAGVPELMAFIERSGLAKAVATSSSREKAMRTLSAVDLASRFDAVVTRTDVARGKPHPDLFLRAAVELDQPVDRCLALEDSYNGIRAAHAAGMKVIMVPDLLIATPEMTGLADAVAPDLLAVRDALMKARRELEDTARVSS